MVLYPAHIVVSTGVGGTLSSQLEMLLAKMVCVITEVASISESRNKTLASSAAADLEDIRQSRQGDNEAYRRLIERHQEHVGRILWRFTRDRQVHEELVQDAFVEAYLSLASYRGKAPLAHWLSRIATRVGYHYWKQTARQHRHETFSLQ